MLTTDWTTRRLFSCRPQKLGYKPGGLSTDYSAYTGTWYMPTATIMFSNILAQALDLNATHLSLSDMYDHTDMLQHCKQEHDSLRLAHMHGNKEVPSDVPIPRKLPFALMSKAVIGAEKQFALV